MQENLKKWHPRPHPYSIYSSGFEVRTYHQYERVFMFHHLEEELGQESPALNIKSKILRLTRSKQCGYQLDQQNSRRACLKMPSQAFEYWDDTLTNYIPIQLESARGVRIALI